jgi:hypothetical protein
LRISGFLILFFFSLNFIDLNCDLNIFLQSPSTVLVADEPLEVDLEVTGLTDHLRGFTMTIEYDTDHFSADPADFLEGSLLSDSGDLTHWEVAGSNGSFQLTCSILGVTPGITGEGSAFSFQLTNQNLDNLTGTDVNITNIVLRDTLNNEILPDNVTGLTVTIDATPVYIDLHVILEGPWISGTTQSHDLVDAGFLPLESPYDDEILAEFPIVSPQYIVDWIWLELRETETGSMVKSCNSFLLNNSALVSTTGDQAFPFHYTQGISYYLIIRQRNHLDIMSSSSYLLSDALLTPTEVDLTDEINVYDSFSVIELETGIFGMFAGDADQDGNVFPSDRNEEWRTQTGTNGYLSADFDLDTNVFPNDLNEFWRINTGRSSQIP